MRFSVVTDSPSETGGVPKGRGYDIAAHPIIRSQFSVFHLSVLTSSNLLPLGIIKVDFALLSLTRSFPF